MPEAARAETAEAGEFDGVVLVRPPAERRLGGMRLFERAVFTLVRAGATRVLCIGTPPPGPLRLPAVDVRWVAAPADLGDWARDARRTVVGVDAATVVDETTVNALLTAGAGGPLSNPGGTLWRCQAPALAALLVAAPDGDRPLPGTRPWTPPSTGLLIAVGDDASQARAETALFRRLGRPDDGWFTRVVDRRLSRLLTRRLLATNVTPNQITVLSIGIGITGGLLFAVGSAATATAGALLFLLSTIVDGCDGEVARLTFRESQLGARLDLIGDNVVHVALFAGIAIGLHRRAPADLILVLGGVLLGGVACAMAAVYTCIARRTPTRAQRRLFEAFASREFAYLLAAMTIAGKLDWFLWLAAGGTYAFAAALWILGNVGTPDPV